MVFGCGFTFIASLMLLVQNNDPQFWKGGKQSGAGPYDHIDLTVSGPFALIIFFPGRQIRIHDTDPVPEHSVKAQQCLVCQGNLRYQHDTLPAPLHHLLYKLHIDKGLAASCNTVQQIDIRLPPVEILHNLIYNPLLRMAEKLFLICLLLQFHRIAERLAPKDPNHSRLLQAADGLGRHAQPAGHPLVRNGLLLRQLPQQPLLRNLPAPSALAHERDDLLTPQESLNRPVLCLFDGTFGGKHRLQSLYHGGSVVFPDPSGQYDHFVFYAYTAVRHSSDFFHSGRIIFTYIAHADTITLQQLIAVSEGNLHAHARLQHILQPVGHSVLKRFIQFFMRNIYDYVCIKFTHPFPPGPDSSFRAWLEGLSEFILREVPADNPYRFTAVSRDFQPYPEQILSVIFRQFPRSLSQQ